MCAMRVQLQTWDMAAGCTMARCMLQAAEVYLFASKAYTRVTARAPCGNRQCG